MIKPNWKIFYGDGETFSENDGPIQDAPAWNVQVIVVRDEAVGRFLDIRHDYYVYRDENWLGVDFVGLIDYLQESGLVKFGRTINSEQFDELYQQAKNDPDFPPKSGYLPMENRH